GAVAHEADAPPFAGEVAEAAADFDVEPVEQLAADLRIVDTLREPDRGELRKPALFGEQAEPQLGERVLELGTDLRVTRPRGVESFVEHDTQSRMERVQHRDGRGVVIAPRAADVVGDEAEIEVPRLRRVHPTPNARDRAVGEDTPRKAGRNPQGLP